MADSSFTQMQRDIIALRTEMSLMQRNKGGITPENLQDFFSQHRHDGSSAGGQNLYGPYFINDEADGHTYKIICTNGVLTAELVV